MTARLIALAVSATLVAACASDQRPTLQPAPSAPPTTAVPSPDEVKAAIRKGLASTRSFRAEMVVRHHLGGERRKVLEVSPDAALVQETRQTPDGERTFVHELFPGSATQSGGPPGGRLSQYVEPWTIQLLPGIHDDPVLFARHVLDWEQFTVAPTDVHGRSAWTVQWSPPRGSNPDHVAVTIDATTGLALRAEAFFENQVVYVVDVASLEVDPTMSLTPPTTAAGPRNIDFGYRRTTLEEASTGVGYRPVSPTWLPAGFVPAEVAFAVQPRDSTTFLHPDSTTVVAALYRRGLDELLIRTRPRGSRPWTNPIGGVPRPEDSLPVPETRMRLFEWKPAVISGGAFAGAQAERTTTAPYGRSMFWALNDEFSLTVQGDVTVDEMQRIVESLRPV